MTVVVAGATGTAGRAYVQDLTAAGYRVRALHRPDRDPTPLARLGAEPVAADLADPQDAATAVAGADAVVAALLGRGDAAAENEATITRHLIDAAAEEGVERFVYTSVHLADADTGVPHFDVKARLERRLRERGLPHTVLRPTTFMDALAAPWLRAGIERDGVLASPIARDTPISYLATRDLARAARLALEDPGQEGATLTLGGPEAVTYDKLLPVFSRLAGQPVTYRQVPLEQVEVRMGADIARMLGLFNERGFTTAPAKLVEQDGPLTRVEDFLKEAWD